jgi:hypothetical protein
LKATLCQIKPLSGRSLRKVRWPLRSGAE